MTWFARNSLSLVIAVALVLVILSSIRPYRANVQDAVCRVSYLTSILQDPLTPHANCK